MNTAGEEPAQSSSSRFFKIQPVNVDLGDVVVQVVAVALGVIIGLAVTAWNERVHERSLLRETVGNIVSELRSNQAGLRTVEKRHAKSAATLAALVASHPASITIAQGRKALRAAGAFPENIPLGIAWQIAQNNQGLTLLPYRERYWLAWIYQMQTVYYNAEERYQNSLVTISESPSGNYYFQSLNLANQGHAVVAAERQLDQLYTGAIAEAKKEYGL